ncbi:hypothetical protein Pst134EB_022069 [Puccinia striiformis f. sp. tritici]|nr:hypothetical protein Pst134EB_022069 [Puccinia striiformis f. sp. tritici]
MPPKRNRNSRRVICTCVTCSQFSHIDRETGSAIVGLLVDPQTLLAHNAAQQEVAYYAQLADNEYSTPKHQPDTLELAQGECDHPTASTPAADNSKLLRSLATLSISGPSPSDSCPNLYDCSGFGSLRRWDQMSPAIILVYIKTALFYPEPRSAPTPLSYSNAKAIKEVPVDVRTVLSQLSIEPELIYFVCCPSCFAMYPDDNSFPDYCSNRRLPQVEPEHDSEPTVPSDNAKRTVSANNLEESSAVDNTAETVWNYSKVLMELPS